MQMRSVRWMWGLAMALALGFAAEARAVAFADDELYLLNDCSSGPCVATGLQLTAADAPEPLAGMPGLAKLDDRGNPLVFGDPNSDYFLQIGQSFVLGPGASSGSPSDVNILQLTFSIGWYGTVFGDPVEGDVGDELLFVITSNRQGTTVFSPPIDSGYVRTSFLGDLMGTMVARDAPLGSPGLIDDAVGGRDYLGIRLPLIAPSGDPFVDGPSVLNPVSFTVNWALRQPVLNSTDPFQHINSGFITTSVPEPGTALLVGLGAAALVLRRRRA